MPKGSKGAKAVPISLSGGRLVSAKSKTGDPACSQAMSSWVRARHGGPPATADVFAILAKCRAKARQNRSAAAKQTSGKLAEGRGTWQRSEKAQELLAKRKRLLTDAARLGIRNAPQPARSLRDQVAASRLARGKADPVKRAETAALLRQFREGAAAAERPPVASPAAQPAKLAKPRKPKATKAAAAAHAPTPATPTTASHPRGKDFADRVLAAAHAIGDEGRYHGDKVYIHAAHAAYEAKHGPIPREEFNARLLESLRDRDLNLSRADLVESMPRDAVRQSETSSGQARFHFIRLPGASAGRSAAPKPRETADEPSMSAAIAASSLRDQVAAHRLDKGSKEQRLERLVHRYGGLATRAERRLGRTSGKATPLLSDTGPTADRQRQLASKAIQERDHFADRKRRLQETLDRSRPAAGGAGAFALRPSSGRSTTFGSTGGATRSLFASDRGAAARDLPGQTTMLGNGSTKDRFRKLLSGPQTGYRSRLAAKQATTATAPASKHTPDQLRALARGVPRVSGGSPAAVLERAESAARNRSRKAKILARQRAEVHEARRSSVRDLAPDRIEFDPERFQYKLAHAEGTGSVGSLSGVRKWDPELGGVLQVWKDPSNGKTYVVNGHNRLDLAKRLGADRVSVRYIKAPDAREARITGALTNIAEGRGTSTDAGAFFRESGMGVEDLRGRGVPLRERTATEGLALSGLEPSLWKQHVNGELPTERAAILGGSGLSHAEQAAVAKTAGNGGVAKLNNRELREYIDNARAAPSATKRTASLFGDDVETVNLGAHRSRVQGAIKERLLREKRVFGTVAKARNAADLESAGNKIDTERSGVASKSATENLGVFDALKNRRGPVSDLLNDAAERIHRGESHKSVTDDVYRRLPAAIRRALDGE